MFESLAKVKGAVADLPVLAVGGTVTYENGRRIHTFDPSQNAADNFQVINGGDVEVLVVAGGGGGGFDGGGGGGAGGMREDLTTIEVDDLTDYTVTTGAGGAGSAISGSAGANGDASSFAAFLATVGGGGGGSNAAAQGQVGGSGGGSQNAGGLAGGLGTAGEGFQGGDGGNSAPNTPGGGGGASERGNGAQSGTVTGKGGDGNNSSIADGGITLVTYAGGGGASFNADAGNTDGQGGAGGGGNGSAIGGTPGHPGTNGLGGGGGGGPSSSTPRDGGDGGDGTVVISYEYTNNLQESTGGNISFDNGWRVHQFKTLGADNFQPAPGNGFVDYMSVAGAGGGGAAGATGSAQGSGGGGGAGGLLTNENLVDFGVINPTLYPTLVGDGGAGSTDVFTVAPNGEDSDFDTQGPSVGGGGGGSGSDPGKVGAAGGSGGGAAKDSNSPGAGTALQGNAGGNAGGGVNGSGGGGGGQSAVGSAGTGTSPGGAGGAGKTLSGWGLSSAANGGMGGGAGSGVGAAGADNTGDGAGGGGTQNGAGGKGGSGIVIVRYPLATENIPASVNSIDLDGGAETMYFDQIDDNETRWTYNCFIKMRDVSVGTEVMFSVNPTAANNNDQFFIRKTSAGLLQAQQTTSNVLAFLYASTNPVFVADDTWYNVHVTYDASRPAGQRFELTVDGVAVAVTFTGTDEPPLVANGTQRFTMYGLRFGTIQTPDGFVHRPILVQNAALPVSALRNSDNTAKPYNGSAGGSNDFEMLYENSSDMAEDNLGVRSWTLSSIDGTDQSSDTPP